MTITINRKFEIDTDTAKGDKTAQAVDRNDEYRRQLIVEAAISCVHEILNQGATRDDPLEADYLLSAVGLKLHESAHSRLVSTLMIKAMLERTRGK